MLGVTAQKEIKNPYDTQHTGMSRDSGILCPFSPPEVEEVDLLTPLQSICGALSTQSDSLGAVVERVKWAMRISK
jgi:hypothetical protein